jgi:hypothetical protein
MPNPVSNSDTPRSSAEPDRLSRLLANRNRDKPSQDTPLPAGLNGLGRERMAPSEDSPNSDTMNELELLRRENLDLRRSSAELQEMVEELRQLEESWGRQQREYEGLLEEKSEVIRTLHQKLQEMQEACGKPHMPAPREEELLSLHPNWNRSGNSRGRGVADAADAHGAAWP